MIIQNKSTKWALAAALALGSIGLIPQSTHAERPEGPGSKVTRVDAHDSDQYSMAFVGGEVATVGVSGDGDTDLDLFIYDENGKLVASDTDPGDDCLVRFIPRWTGRFTVVVRNLGGIYNRYVIVAN